MSSNNTSETVFIGSGDLPENNNTSETMFVGEAAVPPMNNAGETVYMSEDQVAGDPYAAGTVYQPEAQAVAQNALLAAGTMIGEYMVMEPISTKGRESDVYKAIKAQDEYALKLYKRDLTLSEPKMKALMQIQCPYIAKLCDYGTYEGRPYEVYRYYKNGTIENKGKIEGERLKHYINQLNEALHSLHTAQGVAGMVHGDLKPSNIFLSDDEESLILGVCRQGLFAIPILLILNHFVGLKGVVAAQLISDAITFVLATILYRRVYNRLQKEIAA